eukprot:scaffold604758_cov14-Prasinocladus_malaysianus.AAC.1
MDWLAVLAHFFRSADCFAMLSRDVFCPEALFKAAAVTGDEALMRSLAPLTALCYEEALSLAAFFGHESL